MSQEFKIRKITMEDVPEAQEFLFNLVRALFNTEKHPVYHYDIIHMEDVYIASKKNLLVGAFDQSDVLIGTIGIKQFVDRFDALKGRYDVDKTAELGRCYIREDVRRMGVGTLLFDNMLLCCKEQGYEKLYLHTHRHLPGGFDFWQKKNFVITLEEETGRKPVHMERDV